MSIRQQGGVFGRNPKFGTVEADEFIGPVTGTATQADTVEITDNTSSGGTYYPALMTGTSGYGGLNVSSSKLTFQPSSGMLSTSTVNAGMSVANGPLTAFLSASGALYGYYSGGGVIASYSDNSATLSALTFDGSTIALRTGNTPALSLGASDVTVNKGNLVIATSGAGIDFSATSGTGTSELFDDYEEGTWTPAVTAGSGSITSYNSSGTYTKVGRQVTISGSIQITNNGTGASYLNIAGLPFTVGTQGGSGAVRSSGFGGHLVAIQAPNGGTGFTMWKYDNTYPVGTNSQMNFSFSYFV